MDTRTELAIDALLARSGGAVTRRQLTGGKGITRHQLDNAVKRGELVAVAPATYCRPWDRDLPDVQERAALAHLGGAAISHMSALRRWRALDHSGSVHVTVSARRMPRSRPGLIVHRATHFPPVRRVGGLVSVELATALATSWALLAGPDQRGPTIRACRSRLITPAELIKVVDGLPRLPGRRGFRDLALLLGTGCESELEIWGHTRVFRGPGLDHGVRQYVVRAGGATYRLDLAFKRERLGVELDGAASHGSRSQRERDLVRDAALATMGWQVVRFSHRRLHADPDGCRRDLLATLAQR